MNKSLLTHLGVAILFAVVSILAYAWWQNTVAQTLTEATEVTAKAKAIEQELSEITHAKQEVASLEENEEFVRARFLPLEDIVLFLEELEETGQKYGATVSVVSVGDGKTGNRVSVALSAQGSFNAVMKTIGAIEYGSYASAVKSLALDGGGEGNWNASFILEVEAIKTETP
jgi:hypothetical protein